MQTTADLSAAKTLLDLKLKSNSKLYDVSRNSIILDTIKDPTEKQYPYCAGAKSFASFEEFVEEVPVFSILYWQWNKPIDETKDYPWDDIYKDLTDEEKKQWIADRNKFVENFIEKYPHRRSCLNNVLTIVCTEWKYTNDIYVYHIYVEKEDEPQIKEFINRYS